MTRQLRPLACRASLSLDLHAEADQGSFPQFLHSRSGSVLLEGMQGKPGVHWRGSHSSEKGGINSLQGTHGPLGKEDPTVTRQRQLRAAGLGGGGEGGMEPRSLGQGRSGQRSLSCPASSPAPAPSSSWLRFSLFSSKG